MERSDLESYEYQLAQVKQAYAADPTNSELITLKDELEDLIKLTKQYLAETEGASAAAGPQQAERTGGNAAQGTSRSQQSAQNNAHASTSGTAQGKRKAVEGSAPSVVFKAGDECQARYSDGRWYPARIVSVTGSADNPSYSVIFKGYDTTEQLPASDLKQINADKKRQAEAATVEDADREKKRKKNVKKEETRQAKTAEQVGKQQAWQSFAKKGTKKGISIPGLQGESMFKSPDNPHGRVGVVGSGAKMSEFKDKKRHIFETDGSGAAS